MPASGVNPSVPGELTDRRLFAFSERCQKRNPPAPVCKTISAGYGPPPRRTSRLGRLRQRKPHRLYSLLPAAAKRAFQCQPVAYEADVPDKAGIGEIDGALQKATNVPAKQCVNCGDIVVSSIILERLKRYAHDYPANILDYAKCEDEESAGSQILF